MSERKPNSSGPEKWSMSIPDKLMVGSAATALIVGPFNPTAGGVVVVIRDQYWLVRR